MTGTTTATYTDEGRILVGDAEIATYDADGRTWRNGVREVLRRHGYEPTGAWETGPNAYDPATIKVVKHTYVPSVDAPTVTDLTLDQVAEIVERDPAKRDAALEWLRTQPEVIDGDCWSDKDAERLATGWLYAGFDW